MLSSSHIRCGLAATSSIRTINQSNDPGPPNDVLNALNSALNCQAAVVHSFKWCLKWIMPTRCYYIPYTNRIPRRNRVHLCLSVADWNRHYGTDCGPSRRNESMLICEDYIEHILYMSFPLLSGLLFLIVMWAQWKFISLLYARIQQVKSRQSCNYIFISTWFISLSLPFSARSNYIFHTLVMPPIDQQQQEKQFDMG